MKKLVILFIPLLVMITGCSQELLNTPEEIIEYSINEPATHEDWTIEISDAYYVEAPGTPYVVNFDKYLVIDINITNLSNEIQEFSAFSLWAEDRRKEYVRLTLDENHKHFKHELKSGETWSFPLVYPIRESAYYNINYKSSKWAADQKSLTWKINADELETVEKLPTIEEHNDVPKILSGH